MFRCRGEAGSPIEGKQRAFVPPPAGRAGRVPREIFRGKCRIPLAGFASRGTGRVTPPRNASPAFGRLRRPPAALRTAPRAGASPVLQTSPRGTAPPRHKESFASRPARVPRNHFPRCNPRAVLEIKYNRFPLHNRPVSTYPLLLLTAFPQTFASGERSDSPRPCLKKQGRRGGAFPWGGSSLPEGRAFRIPFPSSGKVSPARGAQNKQFLLTKNQKQNFKVCPAERKQTMIACKESQAKLQSPCGAKTNKKL